MNDVWYRFFAGDFNALDGVSGGIPSTLPVPVGEGGTGQITAAEALGELTQALTVETTLDGANDLVSVYDASADTAVGVRLNRLPTITAGTTQATASGSDLDFTGIPAGVQHLSVVFDDVATVTTTALLVQLGSTSAVVATGYLSASQRIVGGTVSGQGSTVGFLINKGTSVAAVSGMMHLRRVGGNRWSASHATAYQPTTHVFVGAGVSNLGAELGRVRITSIGPSTFRGGQVNIHWEF